MSKQSSKSSKKQKREDHSESDSNDDDSLQPIHFFVPGENINAAVLVDYITQYVDKTAKITSSHHPTDKTRTGFNVLAKKTLNAVSLRDIINDSKDWDLETQSKRFRKDPYRYADSDTARRRGRQGASRGGTARPAQQRSTREASTEPETYRRDKATGPATMGNVPAQYSYQGSQSPTAGGYYQPAPKSEYGSSTNYIYNTVNATSYSANVPANTAQYPTGQYQSAYPQPQKPYADLQPPSYEQAVPRGPPRPQSPGNPDPDTFDRGEKPRRQGSDTPASRQGSIPHGDDGSRSYSAQGRKQQPYEESTRRSGHR
ncbi:hypothetical protein LTR99_000255 [Exophiala xenobiotica]|uniref:Uncharacterized protein n=1 Tax=Vermiconidia calcicola TaxID=1690605 RepID=A0AAV9QMM5_9PEZI|nr:hypothetical protein LTR72_000609 [Exophiala xenobiotica]KAK5543913.1 hypothetical protein LTR25_001528 [Vermiconidia calcicola]KAK5548592.1 hypothetical protein LTR23_001722 [Chaetothyriales sp. CCFEE 6169]KAK5274481.1 hypothetical protein LTR96_001082 [Exophiala xenobiotica]KAK5299942.1 hypothetical protein LTR14_002157 [Exophiala xenobiotica]